MNNSVEKKFLLDFESIKDISKITTYDKAFSVLLGLSEKPMITALKIIKKDKNKTEDDKKFLNKYGAFLTEYTDLFSDILLIRLEKLYESFEQYWKQLGDFKSFVEYLFQNGVIFSKEVSKFLSDKDINVKKYNDNSSVYNYYIKWRDRTDCSLKQAAALINFEIENEKYPNQTETFLLRNSSYVVARVAGKLLIYNQIAKTEHDLTEQLITAINNRNPKITDEPNNNPSPKKSLSDRRFETKEIVKWIIEKGEVEPLPIVQDVFLDNTNVDIPEDGSEKELVFGFLDHLRESLKKNDNDDDLINYSLEKIVFGCVYNFLQNYGKKPNAAESLKRAYWGDYSKEKKLTKKLGSKSKKTIPDSENIITSYLKKLG